MIHGYSDYLEGFKKLGYYPGQLFYLPVEEGSGLRQRIGRLMAITASSHSVDSEGELDTEYAAIIHPILEMDEDKGWYMVFDPSAKVFDAMKIDAVPSEKVKLLTRSLIGFGELDFEGDIPSFVPMYNPTS